MSSTRHSHTAHHRRIQELLQDMKDEVIKQKCKKFLTKNVDEYLDSLDKVDFSLHNDSHVLNERIIQHLKELSDNIIKKAELISSSIEDRKTTKKLRDVFRSLTGPCFYKSKYFEKSFIKPRGYPGDFEMMEIIYNYLVASDSSIGKYFDQYYLDSPYAQAVRNRKDKMVEILYEIFSNVNGLEFKVFNIACGSSRELKELFNKPICSKAVFKITCFDHDQEALDYSKSVLDNLSSNIELSFLKGDILSYVRNLEKSKQLFNKYNLVYSMGLADYMPDNLFKRMIIFAHSILKPEGKFIIAHKIEENDPFAPFTPKWVCEWIFNKRNVYDLLRLIEESGIEGYSLGDHIWDDSQRVVFITIIKH